MIVLPSNTKGSFFIMSDKLKRVVIKEELVALTKDSIKAIILNQMIFWGETIERMDQQVYGEIDAYKKLGNDEFIYKLEKKLRHGWFYKTADEMNEEIMISTRATVDRKMKELVTAGFFETRKNPKNKWDKKNQYRVRFHFIREELAKLGYTLDGYKMLQPTNAQNEQPDIPAIEDKKADEPLILPNAQNEQPISQNEHSIGQNEHSYTVSNSSLRNLSLSLEEEEEEKSSSIQLEKSVKEYIITELKYDSTLLSEIAEQMTAFNIDSFTKDEMADQHNFMVEQNKVKRITEWAFYFVNGIVLRRNNPKTKVAAGSKKKRNASAKKVIREEMVPDWLREEKEKGPKSEEEVKAAQIRKQELLEKYRELNKPKENTISEEQKREIWEQVERLSVRN